jgi:hypothetical protein
MTDNPNGTERDIHAAILAVMREVGYVQKERKDGLNYSFAGERALIAALRPSMIDHGIYMAVVEYREIDRSDYMTANQKPMNSTSVHGVVRFTHVPTGTFVDVASIGEGADNGDKSANKAATGMYKYAIRQTFMIETGDDPDATPSDGQERAASRKQAAAAKTGSPERPQTNGQPTGGNSAPSTPASPAGTPPAANGKSAGTKPPANPNGAPSPELITRFNAIVEQARTLGIKIDVDPSKMTVAGLTKTAESIKGQIEKKSAK